MEGELKTFKALEKWYKAEFEKLGWIVLAVSQGHHYKAWMYRHSLVHLLRALETKMRNVSNQDTRKELDIMYNNTTVLLNYVDNTFRESLLQKEGELSPRRSPSILQQFTAPFGF